MADNNLDYDYVKLVYGVDIGPEGKPEPPKPEPDGGEKDKGKDKQSSRMELYDWLQCIVAAILCGILLFVFVGRIIGVDGESMLPTLYNTDKVIMSNLFYEPRYGDIVVVKVDDPLFDNKPLVKRVIATAGQTIDINFEKGEVIVDGYILEEPYIAAYTTLREDFTGPVTVPEGCIFVLGDNRNESTDSRSNHVGMIDTRQIIGKVYWIILPGASKTEKRDWSRIGSVYN